MLFVRLARFPMSSGHYQNILQGLTLASRLCGFRRRMRDKTIGSGSSYITFLKDKPVE